MNMYYADEYFGREYKNNNLHPHAAEDRVERIKDKDDENNCNL